MSRGGEGERNRLSHENNYFVISGLLSENWMRERVSIYAEKNNNFSHLQNFHIFFICWCTLIFHFSVWKADELRAKESFSIFFLQNAFLAILIPFDCRDFHILMKLVMRSVHLHMLLWASMQKHSKTQFPSFKISSISSHTTNIPRIPSTTLSQSELSQICVRFLPYYNNKNENAIVCKWQRDIEWESFGWGERACVRLE